jgi:hypothetical protein
MDARSTRAEPQFRAMERPGVSAVWGAAEKVDLWAGVPVTDLDTVDGPWRAGPFATSD